MKLAGSSRNDGRLWWRVEEHQEVPIRNFIIVQVTKTEPWKFDGVLELDDRREGDGVQKPTGKAELWGRVQLWREALWSEEPVGGASATRGMGGGVG